MAEIVKISGEKEERKEPDTYYSNVFELNISPYDFTFVWGYKTAKQAKAKTEEFESLANVSMSPSQGKAVFVILGEMIKKYEEQFGEIPIAKDFKERFRKLFEG